MQRQGFRVGLDLQLGPQEIAALLEFPQRAGPVARLQQAPDKRAVRGLVEGIGLEQGLGPARGFGDVALPFGRGDGVARAPDEDLAPALPLLRQPGLKLGARQVQARQELLIALRRRAIVRNGFGQVGQAAGVGPDQAGIGGRLPGVDTERKRMRTVAGLAQRGEGLP